MKDLETTSHEELLPVGVDQIIELPSGRTAIIYKGKGLHVRKAQKLMGDDSTLYLNALMSMLVEIDGQYLLMEQYDEMEMADYTELMSAVGGNFTK